MACRAFCGSRSNVGAGAAGGRGRVGQRRGSSVSPGAVSAPACPSTEQHWQAVIDAHRGAVAAMPLAAE
jgi:hypothetical protein